MDMLQEFPILIKEIVTKSYTVKLEQHDDLYVVSYNGKPLHPVSNLTLALHFFDKLVLREDKGYNN